MDENQKILIITDGTDSIKNIADGIVFSFLNSSLKNYHVSITDAENFSVTDLLPCYAFFIGCEMPNPASFIYIEDLFRHINLAGRPCGIFSSNTKTAKYLSSLIRTSEAALGMLFVQEEGQVRKKEISVWVKKIICRKKT